MSHIEKGIPTSKAELREINRRQATLVGDKAIKETIDIADYSEVSAEPNLDLVADTADLGESRYVAPVQYSGHEVGDNHRPANVVPVERWLPGKPA